MAWKVDALKPLKRGIRRWDFISMDTEDDNRGYGRNRGFYLGCVWTPNGGKHFTTRSALIRFLSQSRWRGYRVACHNLEYDALSVFGVEGLCLMEPCYSGSKLCGLTLRFSEERNDSLLFMDTSCFLPERLKDLAKLVNEEKIEIDTGELVRDRRVTRQKIDYCLKDAEITWKLANYLQDGFNQLGAEMKLTAAATSLDAFRRRFLHDDLPCLSPELQKKLHRGYTGGRVEALRLGEYEGAVYQNDVNGAYVSVMIDTELPDLGDFAERSSLDLSQQGMADVDVMVPDHLWAGPLPLKGEKLMFPVGHLRGQWTYNELRQALNYGCRIGEVRSCWSSRRTAPYLREMMVYLRSVRENPETPQPMNRLAKLLGNSLYGKFGARQERFGFMRLGDFRAKVANGELVKGVDYFQADLYEDTRIVRVVTGMDYPPYANVIWSAIITAGCRGLLYPHLEQSSSFYCDTDSVIDLRPYPETKTLGKLALQHSYSKVVIRGNKLYAGYGCDEKGKLRWNSHAKGVPRESATRAVLEADAAITVRRPCKLRTALHGERRAGEWFEQVKRLSWDYDKRRVNADGTTLPVEVKLW